MPLATKFWPYRPQRPPTVVGVYELGRANHVLYVGSGKIRARLRQHNTDSEKHFQQYRCHVTKDRRRAVQIERQQLKSFGTTAEELPKYNKEMPFPP